MYLYGKCPEHPNATNHGYVLEHRLVAENKLRRLLLIGEEVHHINKNRHDNRPENLEIINSHEHRLIHGREKMVRIDVECLNCKKIFKVKGNKYNERVREHRNLFCSRHCNAKYNGLGIIIKPPSIGSVF